MSDLFVANKGGQPMPKLEIAEIERRLNSCLSAARLDECGRQEGLEQRQNRGISTSGLVCSLLSSLGSRKVETLADLHRDFQAANESTVNYKPFYEKLDKRGFGRVMQAVFGSIVEGLTPPILRPKKSSPLGWVDDVIIQDGTSVTLHPALRQVFPSRFTKVHPAGAELHVTMSLWRQAPTRVQIAPDAVAETQFLPAPETLRNKLLLADRGYRGLGYLSEVDRAGGFFAVRISSKANPIVLRVLAGSRRMRQQVGKHLDEALANAAKKECADLIVKFPATQGREECTFRLVVKRLRNARIDHKHCDRWMRVVTNVSPQRLSSAQILQAYRLRWQIELFFKELKSYANLRTFCTRKKAIAEGLFWASLCAAALKRYLAHACELNRQIAAISPRRVAMCAHTFFYPILWMLAASDSRGLKLALARAFEFLSISARRSNPKRERKSGLLALGLASCGVP
jgi:Transposase DDE domain